MTLDTTEKTGICHLPLNRFKKVIQRVFDFHPDIGPEFYADMEFLCSIDADLIKLLNERFSNLPKTLHAPFRGFALINEQMYEGYDNSILNTVFETALLLGCELITFHTGLHLMESTSRDFQLDTALKNAIEIGSLARKNNIRIAFENVYDRDFKLLEKVISSAGKNSGFCLDTGHLNIFSRTDLLSWLTFAPLFEMHIHDNLGKNDSHLSPGEGNFDFDSIYKYLPHTDSKNCLFTFEPATIEIAESGMPRFINFLKFKN